jgi:nucleoside-diphosphate-sugar epimerase
LTSRRAGKPILVRVVVVGATGNIGSSVLQALVADERVESITGVARRLPALTLPKVEWATADVASSDLTALFRGADAVVHLAWLIQPSRDPAKLRRVNVDGSQRVFSAVSEAGVPTLVHGSSVGAYSRGPKDRLVDESWPVDGIPSSFYGRHKAEVERLLDRFEQDHPDVRVVRIRPGLVFKREAASGIRRLFVGPFLPSPLLKRKAFRVVPDIPGLRFQAVHSLDVGDACRLAVVGDAHGAFNLAADPVLDPPMLAEILDSPRLPMSGSFARAALDLAYRLRLQPTPPGWLDLALGVPLLDTTRARHDLGWEPRFTAADALRELVAGLIARDGIETPPLASDAGGPLRLRELITGVGEREHAGRR